MSRHTIAGLAIMSSLCVALILGTQALGGNPNGQNVVTVLGMLGLGISQILGNKDTAETKETTKELSKNLHNGTFERLMREALTKLAQEDGFPLEMRKEDKEDGGQDL